MVIYISLELTMSDTILNFGSLLIIAGCVEWGMQDILMQYHNYNIQHVMI